MDVADLRRLLSPEGLRLLDEVGRLDATADVVRTVSTLRAAGHDAGLVAAVLEQARLRSRAAAKFGDFADRMLFTPAGLEQATRLRVASLHAGRFAGAGIDVVADLGCGIGADALALAALDLGVVAVERDELTAAVAAFNLAPFPSSRVEHGDAEDADLAGIGGVWLDPARRDGATRLTDPGDWSPALDWAFDLARRLPAGIKLGPGLDRALLPDGRMLDETIAWITTDAEPATPFGQAFRVVERFPLDVKTLKRELAARGIGTLEIKKRGVDVDPARFRTQLGLRGSASATLVLTRIAGARAALLVERL